MLRIGYIWFPHFSLQTILLRHPSLRDRPVIVTGHHPTASRVIDASPDCLSAGVELSMTAREAIEIVPTATVLAINLNDLADVSRRVIDIVERFSEAVEEICDDGTWFLPSSFHKGSADERLLGSMIIDSIAVALGLEASISIAPGKFVARLAAQRTEKGAVEIISNGLVAGYLAPLPISLLPLSPRSLERLKLLGISTIGAFAQLPAETLPRRFGREALQARCLASDNDDTPFTPRQRPETVQFRHTFEPPIEDHLVLLSTAQSLLDRLCRMLQAQGRTFRSLHLDLGLDNGRIAERHADLREPTNDPRQCRALLRVLVESLEIDRPADALTVQLTAIDREKGSQGSLFERDASDRQERMTQAIAEISRRYRGRIRRVVPTNDRASLFNERRLALLPYTPDGKVTTQEVTESASRAHPIRLVERDNRIYVVEPGRKDEIVALHARWEADEWWPHAARRTYYRVRTRHGVIATIMRDHDHGRWLLVENYD